MGKNHQGKLHRRGSSPFTGTVTKGQRKKPSAPPLSILQNDLLKMQSSLYTSLLYIPHGFLLHLG